MPSGSTLAAWNANPWRASIEQSEIDRPVTFTGVPCLSPTEGVPGNLTVRVSAPSSQKHISSMQYSGSPFASACCCQVLRSKTGSGGREPRKEKADVSIGHCMPAPPVGIGKPGSALSGELSVSDLGATSGLASDLVHTRPRSKLCGRSGSQATPGGQDLRLQNLPVQQ